MGRRTLNRKELRADYEAAERRRQDEEGHEEEDEVEEDEEEEEEEAAGEDEAGEGEEEEEKPKKKPAKAKAKKPRAAKITRMRVVWAVFSNSNQRVATFDYPRRKEADDMAAKLSADKKTTYFVQPIKEPIEEKKGQ